jgi:ascorbate-specific PTS system EIIC-type component UlaA
MLILRSIVFPSIFALIGTIIIILIVPSLKKLLHLSSSSVTFIREMAIYGFILFMVFLVISRFLSNDLIIYVCLGIFALIFGARVVQHKKSQMEKEKTMHND